jgi:hypothetical protein
MLRAHTKASFVTNEARNYNTRDIGLYFNLLPRPISVCVLYTGVIDLKMDEVTGEWKILHNEELNDLYSSPNISRVIK